MQLLDKNERDRSSHEIAVDARAQVAALVEGSGARFAVVEMPPGPPVLQSVVAEVHGPDPETRRQVAADLTDIFAQTESLRDVDNYMREPYDYWHFEVDQEKAQRRGITVEAINRELAMALGGFVLGDVKQRAGHEPINIVIQVPMAERSQVNRLGDILVQSPSTGAAVPLRELGSFQSREEAHIIYHKDLRPVEYVVADVGGRLAAPIYGMLQVEDKLMELGCRTPDGVDLCDHIYYMGPPPHDAVSGIEWAGEWTVTYETFRDMGIAFGAALVLIYILVVWEFGNFRIPALIMAPIPLTLLGIIPAHTLFFQAGWGGEFTATSMIGWIALAGIIVRNSILLVDFSVHRIQEGDTVVDAVISACKTRTRPILITALALVCGSSVIFFDPIFQGMAISLASGVLVSTILTLVVIPLGCVAAADSLCAVAGSTKCRKFPRGQGPKGGPDEPQGGPPRVGDPLWVRAWGGFASVLFTTIGAIVALVGMLRGLFKSRRARRRAAPTVAPSRPATQAASAMRDREGNPAATVAQTAPVAGAGFAEADAEVARKSLARPVPATPEPPAKVAGAAAPPAKKAAAKRPTKRPMAKKAAGKKGAGKKVVSKKADGKSKPAARKGATRRVAVKDVHAKKALTDEVAIGAPAAGDDADAQGGAAARTPATPTSRVVSGRKKTSGRRGIQLKTLGKQGGDGLN